LVNLILNHQRNNLVLKMMMLVKEKVVIFRTT
jgi:hypothetical protein